MDPLYWKVAQCIIVGINLTFFMELCQNEYSFVNVCTLTFSIIWLVLKLNIHSFSRILWLDTAPTAEDSCYIIGSTVSHRRAASSCHAYIPSGYYTWSANVALKSQFSSIFLPPIIFWQIAVHTYYNPVVMQINPVHALPGQVLKMYFNPCRTNVENRVSS